MSDITIYAAGPCDCPPHQCAAYCDPPGQCINRLEGEVVTQQCQVCQSVTWHHDGACLRCAIQKEDRHDR